MTIQHSSCPLCGNEVLVHYRKARDDGYFERNNITFYKKTFEIVKCLNCGMVFVKNPFDPTLHYKKEEALDKSVYGSYFSPFLYPRARHLFLLALLNWITKKLGNEKARILEIGCGFGQLYRLAHSAGFNYMAVEPSPIRIKLLTDFGLSVFNGTIQEFYKQRNHQDFDIILMDNVIEHMPFPLQIIQGLVPLMTSASYLILVAPNLNDIRRYIFPGWGNKQLMPVGHVNYFTLHTLRYLLETNGFEIIYPSFVTHSIEFSRKIAYLIKLIIERYFKVYPFGLYLCARRRNTTKN